MPRHYVSNIEKKREESRRVILDASLELFLQKGYEKTTTRDIIMKAGILNGSLYNRFKNKEQILYTLVEEAINDALEQLTDLLEKERNPLVIMNLPLAVEIYIASKDRNLAELLYEVHSSWHAISEYSSSYISWANERLEKYGINYDDQNLREIKVMSILGAIGNICGYYMHGGNENYRDILSNFVSIVSGVFNVTVIDIPKLVDSICNIIDSGEICICGYNLATGEKLTQDQNPDNH